MYVHDIKFSSIKPTLYSSLIRIMQDVDVPAIYFEKLLSQSSISQTKESPSQLIVVSNDILFLNYRLA